jgi:hypothetical protein
MVQDRLYIFCRARMPLRLTAVLEYIISRFILYKKSIWLEQFKRKRSFGNTMSIRWFLDPELADTRLDLSNNIFSIWRRFCFLSFVPLFFTSGILTEATMEGMGFEPETGSTNYFLTLYSVFVILKISEYDTWKPFCIFICSLGQNFKAFLHIRAMNISSS